MNTAKFVMEFGVTDPDTKERVTLSVYKHENGGMFAMDASYLDQTHDDDTYPVIADPFTDPYIEQNELMLCD